MRIKRKSYLLILSPLVFFPLHIKTIDFTSLLIGPKKFGFTILSTLKDFLSSEQNRTYFYSTCKQSAQKVYTICADHPRFVLGSLGFSCAFYAFYKSSYFPMTKHDLNVLRDKSRSHIHTKIENLTQATDSHAQERSLLLRNAIHTSEQSLHLINKDLVNIEHMILQLPLHIQKQITEETEEYLKKQNTLFAYTQQHQAQRNITEQILLLQLLQTNEQRGMQTIQKIMSFAQQTIEEQGEIHHEISETIDKKSREYKILYNSLYAQQQQYCTNFYLTQNHWIDHLAENIESISQELQALALSQCEISQIEELLGQQEEFFNSKNK